MQRSVVERRVVVGFVRLAPRLSRLLSLTRHIFILSRQSTSSSSSSSSSSRSSSSSSSSSRRVVIVLGSC
ncbi:hypothetical protein Emed_001689 [Eimeria media]